MFPDIDLPLALIMAGEVANLSRLGLSLEIQVDVNAAVSIDSVLQFLQGSLCRLLSGGHEHFFLLFLCP